MGRISLPCAMIPFGTLPADHHPTSERLQPCLCSPIIFPKSAPRAVGELDRRGGEANSRKEKCSQSPHRGREFLLRGMPLERARSEKDGVCNDCCPPKECSPSEEMTDAPCRDAPRRVRVRSKSRRMRVPCGWRTHHGVSLLVRCVMPYFVGHQPFAMN